MVVGINVINIFIIRRQSNCEDTSDVSTDESGSVQKDMPLTVIRLNIEDIATAPEDFLPDEDQTFIISEEETQNSAVHGDEG